MADLPGNSRSDPAPRWVKILGLVALALVLLFVALRLAGVVAGEHGPGRHSSGGPAPHVQAPAR
jgi:hypothetical protein